MDIRSLKQKLDDMGIRPGAYSFRGGLPSEKYCIAQDEGQWSVYYSERGEKTDKKTFSSESKACQYFLTQIARDPTTRA